MLLSLIQAVKADISENEVQVPTGEAAGSIVELVNNALPWISLTAGVIAFVYLIWSGFIYLTAGGNAESAKKGQAGILNAVIGLVIIALAYTITTAVIGTLATTGE